MSYIRAARCFRHIVIVAFLSAVLWTPAGAQPSPTKSPKDAAQIFKDNSPAIVTISTVSGFGSGVLLDSSGVIVSNLHVVGGAMKASVRLSNGDVYDDVAVVDFDVRRDIVLLKVKGFKLPVVEIGDSDGLAVGHAAFAIGSPKGLELTMSQGIVSGLRSTDGYRVVQTTAPISPGSSGGGLFDDRGRLIGITSFRLQGGENLNFAIPINYVRAMIATTAKMTLEELSATTRGTPSGAERQERARTTFQSAQSANIEGMTREQVGAVLGPPSSSENIGSLTVWSYKTSTYIVRIFFVAGRATRY